MLIYTDKFSDNLKILRKERHMTQRDLAIKLGISSSTIAMMERGERKPSIEMLELIADYFDVRLDDLSGRNNCTKTLKHPSVTSDTITFPVIGEVAAGYNEIALENWIGEIIEVPKSYLNGRKNDDFFVLSVKGNSMYPMYLDGDKVLVLKQNALNKSGDVGVIIYEDEMATLKKIEFVRGQNWLKLIPINPEYQPKLIEGVELEHCRVIGIPKLLIREID